MELRERVARSLRARELKGLVADAEAFVASEQIGPDYMRHADAAIASVLEAMGEPNNTALQAGADQLFGAVHDDWKVDAGLIWQAMLDAFTRENGLEAKP